jgi:hypothetical protein
MCRAEISLKHASFYTSMNEMGSRMTANNPGAADPGRRHSTVVVILAGLAGLAIGALAVFAVTGVTWKIRVELPPPPYPQLSSTPAVSYPSTIQPPPSTIQPSAPSVVPVPPLPPGPHA